MFRTTKATKSTRSLGPENDPLQRKLSSQNRTFLLVLTTCSLIGTASICLSIILRHYSHDTEEQLLIFSLGQSLAQNAPSASLAPNVQKLIAELGRNDSLWPDLVRDLGIALLISAFVTFSIERYSSNRLREHIAYDVLSAAYAKVVPEEIYTQVADNVFRSDVIRKKWEAHISGEFNPDDGTAEITASYTYQILNLNAHTLSFPVVGSIDLDVPTRKDDLPRFESFAVSDSKKRPLIDQNDVKALLAGQRAAKGKLSLERNAAAISFTALVEIPSRDYINVSFKVLRAIRVPGNYILHAAVPADGIKIVINDVKGFKLRVSPLHPNWQALDNSGQEDTWDFQCGILPWQGFKLVSEVVQRTEGQREKECDYS